MSNPSFSVREVDDGIHNNTSVLTTGDIFLVFVISRIREPVKATVTVPVSTGKTEKLIKTS